MKLRVSRHHDGGLGADRILALPMAGNGLLLCKELQARLAVESVGTAAGDALLVTGEGEHGQRDGDGHVDAQLAGFTFLLEARGGRAGASEDGGTVAVFVGVDEINGVVKRLDIEADENGTEDLLLVALHVRGNVGDDGGTNLNGKNH